MKSFYLLDYLKENTGIDKSKLELLKYELDERIYYFGDHFSHPKEKKWGLKEKIRFEVRDFLRSLYIFKVILTGKKTTNGKNVISSAYFSVNEELDKQNINIFRPLHNLAKGNQVIGDTAVLKKFIKINKIINKGDFQYLISAGFFKLLDEFESCLLDYYRSAKVDALVVSNDIAFFEQLNIRIFKKLQKPSFIFLHGLPARYNIYDDNQTDYLVVWGKQIKEHYVKTGFNPDKILVSGHPFYNKLGNVELRNSLNNILVLSNPLSGGQHRDRVRVVDRGHSIFYLRSIEQTLKRLGVKQVRLRVHPSENIDWYFKFIDKNFFVKDCSQLNESLNKSTLVIGPTSTVFLEAIYYGVNYIVYEPVIDDVNVAGFSLVPPFDCSDSKVLFAQDENILEKMIKGKVIVDATIFNDYVDTPFDIKCITDLI